ncbi:plasmid replication initiator TrfA [Salinicola sp. NYA28a]
MSSDPMSTIKRWEQRAAAAKAKQAAAPGDDISHEDTQDDGNQLSLPLEMLAHGARGAPDSILRSAIFTSNKPGKRRMLDDEKVASVSSVTIRQTGPQLYQKDLDVWLELIRLGAEQGHTVISIPVKTMLHRLSRSTGSLSRQSLADTIRRLNSVVVTIEDRDMVYDGALVFEQWRDKDTSAISVRINSRIASLFQTNRWSQLQLAHRARLSKQPLAQWLHSYYSTHDRAYPTKVETLRSLCGSATTSLRRYRQSLKAAMESVAEVTGWTWHLTDCDKLVVDTRGRL